MGVTFPIGRLGVKALEIALEIAFTALLQTGIQITYSQFQLNYFSNHATCPFVAQKRLLPKKITAVVNFRLQFREIITLQ